MSENIITWLKKLIDSLLSCTFLSLQSEFSGFISQVITLKRREITTCFTEVFELISRFSFGFYWVVRGARKGFLAKDKCVVFQDKNLSDCVNVFCLQAADGVYSMVTEHPTLPLIHHKDKDSSTTSQQQQQQQQRPQMVGKKRALLKDSLCGCVAAAWSQRMQLRVCMSPVRLNPLELRWSSENQQPDLWPVRSLFLQHPGVYNH